MARYWLTGTVVAACWLSGPAWSADDAAEVVQKQRETAKANWKRVLDAPPEVYTETKHLLVYATQGRTVPQLRHIGRFLESELPLTRKAIGIEAGDELWPGKLAVYLFDEPRQLHTFVLTAGKKRPQPGQLAAFSVRGQTPYVAAAQDTEGNSLGAPDLAGEQLAEAIITSKGGADVPAWVIAGFGRATLWHANPNSQSTRDQKARVRKVAARVSAMDIWTGNVEDDAAVLSGSLVEFLAYGPGAKAFPKFLEGFKPGEGGAKKTVADALKAAQWDPDRVNYGWRRWAHR
jgi:hypothetical protein